jgi:transposase InsO family protein
MGPSTAGCKYLLFLKDDLSGYLWLVPAKAADAETTVESLTSWFTTFGVVPTWVSDQGSLFKNELVDGVRRALRTRHHFKPAYSPWENV